MQRIAIVGQSGSGKSTLAKELARRLDLRAIDIDGLNWLPNWTERTRDELFEIVSDVVKEDRWAIDGNYSRVRGIIWSCADTVIWLDYSFPVTFGRLIKRTYERVASKQELWSGNRESLKKTFSRDSILLWCLTTYRRRRRDLNGWMNRPEYAHLDRLRFRSPRETDRWLARLCPHD
jgi:adenylate kinase family enzyme